MATDCYDGLRNFNQVRPAVFDGGYAFTSYFPGGIDSGSAEVTSLPAGTYIVETAVPPGYETGQGRGQERRFRRQLRAGSRDRAAVLVGDLHLVPPYLTLFPTPRSRRLTPA